jgi:DNA-binding protein H-NS
MAKIDLSPLSIEELQTLIKNAGMEIMKRQKDLIVEARDRALAILEDYGVMAEEVLKVPGRVRAAKKKAPPKYRHPKNPDQTWAGRGRMPGWLVSELKKKGVKLDNFLIK